VLDFTVPIGAVRFVRFHAVKLPRYSTFLGRTQTEFMRPGECMIVICNPVAQSAIVVVLLREVNWNKF
jgi:hypothetical protein